MKAKLLLMLTAFLVIIFACEDDEDDLNKIIPDELVGTWIMDVSEPWVGRTTEYYKTIISKTDSKNGAWKNIWIGDYPETNVLLVLEGTKGTFTVDKDMMYLEVTHFGTQIALNDIDIYDTTMWWGENDPEFSNFELEVDKLKFDVERNTLTFYIDGNNDGDYTDEDDDINIYTKAE